MKNKYGVIFSIHDNYYRTPVIILKENECELEHYSRRLDEAYYCDDGLKRFIIETERDDLQIFIDKDNIIKEDVLKNHEKKQEIDVTFKLNLFYKKLKNLNKINKENFVIFSIHSKIHSHDIILKDYGLKYELNSKKLDKIFLKDNSLKRFILKNKKYGNIQFFLKKENILNEEIIKENEKEQEIIVTIKLNLVHEKKWGVDYY